MTYKFLPDVALADVAFRAESDTVSGLFQSCAEALTDIMVDPATVVPVQARNLSLKADDLDRLLYDFLTEMIIMKDVDSLLFSRWKVDVSSDGTRLSAQLEGESIDRGRHALRNDVKAVTMHMFGVSRTDGIWEATVVLDI